MTNLELILGALGLSFTIIGTLAALLLGLALWVFKTKITEIHKNTEETSKAFKEMDNRVDTNVVEINNRVTYPEFSKKLKERDTEWSSHLDTKLEASMFKHTSQFKHRISDGNGSQ